MHEGLAYDLSTDHRAPKDVENNHKQNEILQHVQISENRKENAKGKKREQVGKKKEKDQGKQSVTMANESTPKSKNKPSKQKRDAAKI